MDYVIDSITTAHSSAAVYIRQKNYGTDVKANGNRVWISFFSKDLRRVNRLVSFDGEAARVVVQLPFKPDFAIVDYDGELSKASIGMQATIVSRGIKEMSDACFKVECVVDSTNAWLYVKHHWTHPDTATNPGIIRMATRFWEVTGQLPDNALKGYFYFARMGEDRTLDANFIANNNETKSVRLLYREDAASPWRIIPTTLEGSTAMGYFVTDNLSKGQYTMAMVDTNLLAVEPLPALGHKEVKVFPNPSSGDITIETPLRGEPLEVDVIDNAGKRLFSEIDAVSGEKITLPLATGNYLFVVHRKETGTRTTVKVQFKKN